jgi:hypothetical protein
VALPAYRDADLRSPAHVHSRGWNAYRDEIAKLGPLYTHPAPVQQGEPVYQFSANTPSPAWFDISKESFDEYTKRGGEWLTRIVYTHAVDGEVEALQKHFDDVLESKELDCRLARGERDTLRAQLADAHALLREIQKEHPGKLGFMHGAIADALSASAEPIPFPGYPPVPEDRELPAEPSTQVERDENAAFESWARSRITPLKLQLDEIGLYHDLVAGTAHDAWQARAALERKPGGDIPDFTPGSGNKAERRATELVAQLQADLNSRDQRVDMLEQQLQLAGHWLEFASFSSTGEPVEHTQVMRDEFRKEMIAAVFPDYVQASTHCRLNGVLP